LIENRPTRTFFRLFGRDASRFNRETKEIVDTVILGFTFSSKTVWNPHR